MGLQINVVSSRGSRFVEAEDERTTVGRGSDNHICLVDDSAASHLHAVLERFASSWCVTDLGSSNGTWLNGKRIWSSQRLRSGDEIRIGHSRLLVRGADGVADVPTDVQAEPPALTTRERDVLVALCRPLLARDMFTEPAPTSAIAEGLGVTSAAVKQHLANLYDKFGISGEETGRRARLANEALRRGAVAIAELRPADGK